jgi:YYY domain-containing protein
MEATQSYLTTETKPSRKPRAWVYDGLLVLVLLAGLYIRLVGTSWDEGQYLHPDERFLMFVESSITPVESLGEYFNTAISRLNPHNTGHGFFVYGTWPIFFVRYLLDWLGNTGGEVYLIGRPLSALVNIATVFLVYLAATRLFDRRVGLLAAAFSSFSVLDIQLSHFFKEDTFVTFFIFLSFYIAVLIATGGKKRLSETESVEEGGLTTSDPLDVVDGAVQQAGNNQRIFLGEFRPQWALFILFGLTLAMAMASKLNAVPIALVLPLAVLIRLNQVSQKDHARVFFEGAVYLAGAAIVSIVAFRILQPYAFSGPGFLGIIPNARWLDNLSELRRLTSPDSLFGFPPSLQWADRTPVLFALENLVRWGLGLPLGVLAWVGFFWVTWRMVKGEWGRFAMLWGWTVVYFGWQSTVFNPTMRYQLPVYPALTILAAWAVVRLWDFDLGRTNLNRFAIDRRIWRTLAVLVGAFTLAGTIIWALAFTGIYTRPVTRVAASRWIFQNIPGPINLHIQTRDEVVNQPLPFPADMTVEPQRPFSSFFTAQVDGLLYEVQLNRAVDHAASGGEEILELTISQSASLDQPLGVAILVADPPAVEESRGQTLSLRMDPPIPLQKGETYQLFLVLQTESEASYGFTGAALANESTWDDGLPLRLDSYDPYGGIYQGGLNFELYWEDTPEKIDRFVTTLNEADYVMISSSRQWGSIGRLPERYPMSNAYYRSLVGCPDGRSVEWCYNHAEVGKFQGQLGFELFKIFQSNPIFGPFEFNDQPSEEAFTVYDHPKVLIFKKTESYDPNQVQAFFDRAYYQTALQTSLDPTDEQARELLLPEDRLSEQRQGGTWIDIFDPTNLINRFQGITVVVWYLALSLIGWSVYPLVRSTFPGLGDRGYPIIRTVGLLLLSYIVWLLGSYQIQFTRLTISVVFALLVVVGAVIGYRQREILRIEWRSRRRYYLIIEGLFLTFFLVGLFIRIGNPDLWHPWKGGEKPMDFSYLNAVLKSTSFPPYDPWYAGGYINYYYYGFVFVGVLIKWLGITPSVAYNLVLPTLFAMIALGAFSIGWNLVHRRGDSESDVIPSTRPYVVGLSAASLMAVLGNLGIVQMMIRGFQRLAASGAAIDEAGFLDRLVWTVRGFLRFIGGSNLPYGLADWYWNPSRAIPAPNDIEPITEFPFFTFLYADLHAHLIALPIALLVIAWGLSVFLSRSRWSGLISGIFGMVLGGLAIGALRPTNTWDFYPYLALGGLAIGYAIWQNFYLRDRIRSRLPKFEIGLRGLAALAGMGLLVVLAFVLYQPYSDWYVQGYNAVDIWRGTHTPVGAYFYHWGVFLFVIVTWMVWETRNWLAATPLSALRKLEPYRWLIQLALVLSLVIVAVMIWFEIAIAWLVVLLAGWAGVLIFRPGMADTKRAVLFMVGTGLVLTLMVEVIVLRGDIGRMNTVFKFYLQVWTLFAVSAAGAFGWLLGMLPQWKTNWRRVWQIFALVLVASAGLYPLMGGLARIRDRMTTPAPNTLDGMAYMSFATYQDLDTALDLSQDYRAIRWLQENVIGSPVIVEANLVEYHWGTRYSIYTGLPGVLGWNWHQRQQRARSPVEFVNTRLDDIHTFYTTTEVEPAVEFLDKYDVKYIILGQLERARYPGSGLLKFASNEGVLWQEVYREGETVIYEVIESRASGSKNVIP